MDQANQGDQAERVDNADQTGQGHIDHIDHIDHTGHTDQADDVDLSRSRAGELDLGLDDIEREADLATLARIELELAEVEQAMRRIEEGTYGACESCQSPIEAEVLEVRPTARHCRAHQQA